jgi:hypothetical protein
MKKLVLAIILIGTITISYSQEFKITRMRMTDIDIPMEGKVHIDRNKIIIDFVGESVTLLLKDSFNGEFPFKSLLISEEKFQKTRIMLTNGEEIKLIWDEKDEFTNEVVRIIYVLDML